MNNSDTAGSDNDMRRIIKILLGIVISGILLGMMPVMVSATAELPSK